jgi:levanase/fructan beta-fructosidase
MKNELYVQSNYLLIPIAVSKECKTVAFIVGEKKAYEFRIPMMEDGDSTYQYHAPIPIGNYKGSYIHLEGDYTERFLQEISQSDHIPAYEEKHPLLHFTANTGWINDPNGLIYDNGIYHLYFQYNPFDKNWENMCWGHAISKDLLHWEQKETVLYPDQEGLMYSGCGIINEQGLLGLPKEAHIFFYTCAGDRSNWSKGTLTTQKIAYSTDGGNTLIKKEGVVVPHICGENRDPKVYWHEQTKAYYMVLYLEEHDFALFRSTDLEQWTMTQKLTFDKAWECPDLREIPIVGGGVKWMFWCADGYYYLGEFDGYTFETDGILREAYKTSLPYAAQTYWGIEERVVIIPWLRSVNKNKLYTGAMGIPRELRLIERNDDYVLSQLPIKEFEDQKELVYEATIEDETGSYHQKEGAVIEISLDMTGIKSVQLSVFEILIQYQASSGIIRIGETDCLLGERLNNLCIIMDREIIEVTAKDGTIYAVFEVEIKGHSKEISITVEGNTSVQIFQVR